MPCNHVQLEVVAFALQILTTYIPEGRAGGGGHLHWEVVRGCAAVMTPFLRPVGAPYPTNLLNAPLTCPRFQFLEKCYISARDFSLLLAKISALKTQIFKIFVPKTSYYPRKSAINHILLETRAIHTPTPTPTPTPPPKKKKNLKKGVCMPPPGLHHISLKSLLSKSQGRGWW